MTVSTRATAIEVDLLDGALSSASTALVLNGANAAAIQSSAGTWEIIQFEQAEEVAASRWRLTNLLRGQAGTEDAMQAGADAGADFVLLDAAVMPVGLRANEIGLTLNWRVGAASAEFSDANFLTISAAGGLRSRIPYAPAHLKGVLEPDGDLFVSWIRRARLGSDDWEPVEIPLDEPTESYRIEVVDSLGTVLRSATVSSPGWTYTEAARLADLGALPHAFDLRVRQIGACGDGIAAIEHVKIN